MKEYPGMENYYIGEQGKRKLSKVHLQSPDTKFCTLVVMCLFLMFTALSLYKRRDINEMYWTNTMVTSVF